MISDDRVTQRWRDQLAGLIPEYAAEERKVIAAVLNGNQLRAAKHLPRAMRLERQVRFRIENLAKLVEIGEPEVTTKSGLSRITRNGDFLAGFDRPETTARFVVMLLEIFPHDRIELNGNLINPLDGPTSWEDIMERWLPDDK